MRLITGLAIAALLSVSALAASDPARPNYRFTPGVATPISKTKVCTVKWGKDARHVTLAMKQQVFAAYGIPWTKHADYEVDHLISRELGGADDVKNLWAEPWYLNVGGSEMGAHQKDRAENATHKAVCAGTITLAEAQAQIAKDWTVLYQRFVGEFPPAVQRAPTN